MAWNRDILAITLEPSGFAHLSKPICVQRGCMKTKMDIGQSRKLRSGIIINIRLIQGGGDFTKLL